MYARGIAIKTDEIAIRIDSPYLCSHSKVSRAAAGEHIVSEVAVVNGVAMGAGGSRRRVETDDDAAVRRRGVIHGIQDGLR